MKAKRIIAVLISTCMAFTALTGCGGNSEGSGSKTSEGKMEAVHPTHPEWVEGIEVNDIPDDQKDITILMSAGYDYWETLHSDETPEHHIVAKQVWEETFGGTVTIQVVTETLMTSYLASAIATETAPDIIPTQYPDWAISDFYVDLSDEQFAERLDWDNEELWDKNFSAKYVWEEEWTGLRPYTEKDPQVVVYNKTKFEEAAEKTPLEYYNEGTWTWTQFVQTAKNMTDITKNEYGYIGFYIRPSVQYRMDDEGHFYLDIDDKQTRINNEIFKFYQAAGHPARRDTKNWDFRTLFASGTDAMTVMGLNEYKRLLVSVEQNGGDEFGVAPLFSWDVVGETTPRVSNSSWAYMICSASDNQLGAAEYIHLEACIMQRLDELQAEKEKDMYFTEEEQAALQEIYALIDSQTVDMENRTYSLSVEGLNLDPIFTTAQSLSMQGIIDSARPTIEANLAKINNTIDLYRKEKQKE